MKIYNWEVSEVGEIIYYIWESIAKETWSRVHIWGTIRWWLGKGETCPGRESPCEEVPRQRKTACESSSNKTAQKSLEKEAEIRSSRMLETIFKLGWYDKDHGTRDTVWTAVIWNRMKAGRFRLSLQQSQTGARVLSSLDGGWF